MRPGRSPATGRPSERPPESASGVPASGRAQQLAEMLEVTPDLVGSFGLDGRLRSANPALRRLLRVGDFDLGGFGLENLLEPEGVEFIRGWAIPYARRLGTWTGELTFAGPSGSQIPVSLVLIGHDAPDADGLISMIARDLTERLRGEEEMRSRLAAEAAAQAKSDFLAVMSHEIRTPLNAVIGMTDLLRATSLSSDQRECVEAIRTSGEGLLSLVGDILDLSKIEAGQVEIDIVGFDLRSVVEEVEAILADPARARRIELMHQVDPVVPSRLRGDPTRLRQVLLNLVGNAVKFTEDGDVLLAVRPAAAPDGSRMDLQFEVSDSGTGIAPDAMARLFSPFSQADGSMSRRYGGSGLGLVISRRLVSLMGGDMGVESHVGLGSTFWFTVRFEIDGTGDAETNRPTLAGRRVLVLSRNETHRAVLVARLGGWGMNAMGIGDGRDAGDWLRAAEAAGTPADILLADVPLADGRCSIEAILPAVGASTGSATIPLVLLVPRGYRPSPDSPAAVVAHVAKPARDADLAGALESAVSPRSRDDARSSSVPRGAPPGAHAGPGSYADAGPRRDAGGDTPEAMAREPSMVLLVEDNVINQKVAAAMLRRLGVEVDVVADGHEAVAAVRRRDYRMVFMDCQLPGMDGVTATATIRAGEGARRVPIVAVTANGTLYDRDRCLAAGMDGYLVKPVRPESLAAALARWLPNGP